MSKYRVWIEIDEELPSGEFDSVEVLWGPTCEVETLEEAQAIAVELHEIGKEICGVVPDDDFEEHFTESELHELDGVGTISFDDESEDPL